MTLPPKERFPMSPMPGRSTSNFISGRLVLTADILRRFNSNGAANEPRNLAGTSKANGALTHTLESKFPSTEIVQVAKSGT